MILLETLNNVQYVAEEEEEEDETPKREVSVTNDNQTDKRRKILKFETPTNTQDDPSVKKKIFKFRRIQRQPYTPGRWDTFSRGQPLEQRDWKRWIRLPPFLPCLPAFLGEFFLQVSNSPYENPVGPFLSRWCVRLFHHSI